jgi:hypothetical protein
MAERKRAWMDGELVTILEQKGNGKRAKFQVRTSHGFVHDNVPASALEIVPDDEPEASFTYEET